MLLTLIGGKKVFHYSQSVLRYSWAEFLSLADYQGLRYSKERLKVPSLFKVNYSEGGEKSKYRFYALNVHEATANRTQVIP